MSAAVATIVANWGQHDFRRSLHDQPLAIEPDRMKMATTNEQQPAVRRIPRETGVRYHAAPLTRLERHGVDAGLVVRRVFQSDGEEDPRAARHQIRPAMR